MKISEKKEGEFLVLSVEGKVDTVTAPQLQTAILSAFQKSDNVKIDCAQLLYTSSAGLRAFLIGQKTASSKGGKLVICNVSEMVMTIFKGTGFDKALNIE